MNDRSDGDGSDDPIPDRIERLAEQAAADEATFARPDDPPAEAEAISYLVNGVGPVIRVYIDARTGGTFYPFSNDEYAALEGAMNTWLGLYAACYGVSIDPSVPLRTAAETLLDTHDLKDVARVLTSVPGESL